MSDDTESVERLLQRGLQLSRQGSYHRRAPSQESIPLLRQARAELEAKLKRDGDTTESLRLVALAQEALLDYASAIRSLKRLIALSQCPDKKDLKRLAACMEASGMWRTLALEPTELSLLGRYLRDKLMDSNPERSLKWTETWLVQNKPEKIKAVLSGIKRLNCSSDYEVLHNLVPG